MFLYRVVGNFPVIGGENDNLALRMKVFLDCLQMRRNTVFTLENLLEILQEFKVNSANIELRLRIK